MFKQAKSVFMKEVIDLFRDKKTWLTSILLPVLLFPALMVVIALVTQSAVEDAQSSIPVAIDDPSGIIAEVIQEQGDFQVIETMTSYREAIEEGQIRFFIEVDENIEQSLQQMESADIVVHYDRSNQRSELAYTVLRESLQATSNDLLEERLSELDLSLATIEPLQVIESSVATPEQESGTFMAMIIPLFLLISCISGGLSAATDLVAGEKERGTLEALVTTPVGGSPVMIGKMLTVMLMSFISSLLSLTGLAIVFGLLPTFFAEEQALGSFFTPDFIFVTIIILLLVSAMVAAIQLSLSTIAKSFKEAQTYNTPLIVVAMLPAYLLMFTPATEIPFHYYFIPFVNVIAIFKEVLADIIHPLHLGVVIGSSLVYVALAVILFAYLFKKESFILK